MPLMGRQDTGTRMPEQTVLHGNAANEVCCSFRQRKLNHSAKWPFPLIMKGLKEGLAHLRYSAPHLVLQGLLLLKMIPLFPRIIAKA